MIHINKLLIHHVVVNVWSKSSTSAKRSCTHWPQMNEFVHSRTKWVNGRMNEWVHVSALGSMSAWPFCTGTRFTPKVNYSTHCNWCLTSLLLCRYILKCLWRYQKIIKKELQKIIIRKETIKLIQLQVVTTTSFINLSMWKYV